jgi:hypothetical protein
MTRVSGAGARTGLGGLARAWWLALALAAGPAAGAGEPPAQSSIAVRRDGETFVVVAVLFAPVTRREAWEVLTDFDRMAGFVPSLSESRVLNRTGDRLTVFQKGVVRFGILAFAFESLREVDLEAEQVVRSRNIGGNLRRLDSFTGFAAADAGTLISYRVEVIPEFWIPGFIGEALLRHEVAEQFEAIVGEMLRRRAGAGPRP